MKATQLSSARLRSRRILVLLVSSIAFAPGLSFAADTLPLAPVHTIDGEVVTETELPTIGDGRWTLVMLWATDCPICKEQYPLISDFHDRHQGDDAQVIGIALDGVASHALVEEALTRYPIRFPTYVGNTLEIADDYTRLTQSPLRGTPTYLLFDPDGELVGDNPGPLTEGAVERFMASKASAGR